MSVDLTLVPTITRLPLPRVPSTLVNKVVPVTGVALAVQPPDVLMEEPAGQALPVRPLEATAADPILTEVVGPPAPHALPPAESSLVP